MVRITLIALGGAAGSVLRYLLTGWIQHEGKGAFPLGTMTVNVVGCLLLGFLTAMFLGPWLVRPDYRFAITIGILGGFTTFSSFGWETVAMLNDRQWLLAMVNVVGNNVLGLSAAWLGYRLPSLWA